MPDMVSTNLPVNLNSEVKVDVVKKENKIPSNIKIYDKKGQVLGKDDFLKLFVTQLSKQDPLNPVNDKEFIAQMAQFSSLEQMNNVSSNIRELKSIQSNAFVGKLVSGKDAMSGNIISGIVTRIIYDNAGNIFLKTKDNTVEIKDVTSVEKVKKENVSRETISKQPEEKANPVAMGKAIIGDRAISEYLKNMNQDQPRER
ncbi:MAG: endoflagellar hook capping protein [Spirochaetia bacterium]|nr:endoflagellar hook capping protein [Spirochaetia bacterium]